MKSSSSSPTPNAPKTKPTASRFRTYGVNLSLEPGKTATAKIKADKPGVFSYYCTEFCSALHLEMTGFLVVKPKGFKRGSDSRRRRPSLYQG